MRDQPAPRIDHNTSNAMTQENIAPEKMRFIKLGEGGAWAPECFQKGSLRLGYASDQHKACEAGEWPQVKAYWLNSRKGNQGVATRDVNQIRDFYELADTDVWITLHQRKLHWCRAAKEVTELDDKTRIRKVIDPWRCTDLSGKDLWIENLDGRVTQLAGFRGTICNVEQKDYLVRKINGEKSRSVMQAEASLHTLVTYVEELVKGLWWHDFELLIELIFSKFGWQRFSVMGAREKDIDLDLRLAANQKRALVQIKSHTTRHEAQNCISNLSNYPDRDEVYFVYHTCPEDLSALGNQSTAHVWGPQVIARHVVNTGLAEWLIHKRS